MEILEAIKQQENLPSTKVEREDNLRYDLAYLAAFDPSPIDFKVFKENPTEYLAKNGRDSAQLLFNQIFNLPAVPTPPGITGVLVELPKPQTPLPREKPLPQARALTKWQEFAKSKGITKKKKERMVYSREGELKPRWGYKRTNDELDDWVIEAKPSDGLGEDPFSARETAKKERTLKQATREKRNRVQNEKVLGKRLPSTIVLSSAEKGTLKKHKSLDSALHIAQKSTISVGKFDKSLPNEKRKKERKQKVDATKMHGEIEKNKNLKVLTKILPEAMDSIDYNKAANQFIADSQHQQSQNKSKKPFGNKKRKRQ